MNTRQVVLVGLVLGLTAAAVVWYLERFQTQRMTDLWREFLDTLPTREEAEGGS